MRDATIDTSTTQEIHPSRRGGRARAAAKAVGVAAVLTFALVLAHRPILVGFAHLFRADDPAPSDAIVVLLGGETHRPVKAAELYRNGLAPLVLLGQERGRANSPLSTSDLIQRYLVKSGVPADAVVILPGVVSSTRDEAERVAEYIDRHPLRRITVVTTAFHTARARWIFRRTLAGRNVDVHTAAVSDPRYDESNWFQDEDGLVYYTFEALKTIFYRLKF